MARSLASLTILNGNTLPASLFSNRRRLGSTTYQPLCYAQDSRTTPILTTATTESVVSYMMSLMSAAIYVALCWSPKYCCRSKWMRFYFLDFTGKTPAPTENFNYSFKYKVTNFNSSGFFNQYKQFNYILTIKKHRAVCSNN